jgi:hypothetical protein
MKRIDGHRLLPVNTGVVAVSEAERKGGRWVILSERGVSGHCNQLNVVSGE